MLLVKVLLSALIVGLVSVLGERYPALGGYVAVLPVVTFLSLIAFVTNKHSSTEVSTFLIGALSGIALTSLTLILMLAVMRSGFSVTSSVLIGASVWALLAFAAAQLSS